jgi:hypothetical protein
LRRTRVGDISVDQCQSIDNAVAAIRQADIEMPEFTDVKSTE